MILLSLSLCTHPSTHFFFFEVEKLGYEPVSIRGSGACKVSLPLESKHAGSGMVYQVLPLSLSTGMRRKRRRSALLHQAEAQQFSCTLGAEKWVSQGVCPSDSWPGCQAWGRSTAYPCPRGGACKAARDTAKEVEECGVQGCPFALLLSG